MKQGLLLTLKELIRLGIIKTKRRKKRKTSSQLTTMSSMDKGLRGIPLSIQSRRYNEFLSASQPPSQMPYTDNLRLRDEQSNFNTRLIEYKNQLENEKSLLENRQKAIMDDINYSKIAVGNELQKLNSRINRNSNWEDDNTDLVETFGSDNFKSQIPKVGQTEGQDESPSLSTNPSMPPPRPPSSIYRMLSQQSDDADDDISDITSPKLVTSPKPPIRVLKSRGRPKSTIPLKERRRIQYLRQKEKKKTQQLEGVESDYDSIGAYLDAHL